MFQKLYEEWRCLKLMCQWQFVTNKVTRYFNYNIYFWLRFVLENAMIINGYKFVLCVSEIFNLWGLLIEFVIPNLSRIYFCIPEIIKVIVWSKSWCKMFLLKLSGIHIHFNSNIMVECGWKYCTLPVWVSHMRWSTELGMMSFSRDILKLYQTLDI